MPNQDEYKEAVFVSSSGAVRDFIDNNGVWEDLKAIMVDRINALLITTETAMDINEIRFAQGAMFELRNMPNIPQLLLECIEEEEEQHKEEREDA